MEGISVFLILSDHLEVTARPRKGGQRALYAAEKTTTLGSTALATRTTFGSWRFTSTRDSDAIKGQEDDEAGGPW